MKKKLVPKSADMAAWSMRKSCKVFIQIIYFVVGTMIVVGCYFFMDWFIPKPWPGIASVSAALLINETLGRYLLRRLWGIDRGSVLDFFKKNKEPAFSGK